MILIAITKLTVYICKTEAPHATTPLCSPATLPLDASSVLPVRYEVPDFDVDLRLIG